MAITNRPVRGTSCPGTRGDVHGPATVHEGRFKNKNGGGGRRGKHISIPPSHVTLRCEGQPRNNKHEGSQSSGVTNTDDQQQKKHDVRFE